MPSRFCCVLLLNGQRGWPSLKREVWEILIFVSPLVACEVFLCMSSENMFFTPSSLPHSFRRIKIVLSFLYPPVSWAAYFALNKDGFQAVACSVDFTVCPCLLVWPVLFLLCGPWVPVVEKAILGSVVMMGGWGKGWPFGTLDKKC